MKVPVTEITSEQGEPADSFGRAEVWRALIALAKPHGRQFLLIAVLALLGTCADLIEPLVYRVVVNDIAGLFVEGGEIAVQHKAAMNPSASVHEGAPARAIEAAGEDESEEGASAPAPQPAPEAKHVSTRHHHGHVAPRKSDEALRTLIGAVLLLLVLNIAAHYFQLAADQRTAVVSSRIERGLIVDTFTHTLRLPLSFFSRRSSGGLTKQIDQIDQVSPIISAFALELAPEVLRMVGILAIMLTQSWKLTLVALLTLPPYLWVVRRSAKRLESSLDGYYQMWEGITGRIQDALGAIKTVKLSGAEPRECERLGGDADVAFARHVERNRLANRYLLWQNSLTYAGQALTLGFGGFLVFERQLTPGDVVMFVAYLDKLYSPIDSLSSLAVTLQEHLASVRRSLRLLHTPGGENPGAALRPGPGEVEFRRVTFSYVPEREVLKALSFTLQPGRVTAIVGPSGAGKTTLADLLLKLYEPASGEILIDGQSLSSLDPASVRNAIGVVAADGAIFSGSLADNIRYKRPEATDEDVLAAARAAGLAATLERLPEGLASEIGERGIGLSVGERQRLQIARVLASKPRVLILDEATANLDYATENDIRHALLSASPRPTTLVIAHRYSMVKDADQVIVLEAGRILEQGTPQELTAAAGWFAAFALDTQSKGPEVLAEQEPNEGLDDEDEDEDDEGDEDDTESGDDGENDDDEGARK